jgi:hypothetical protein
MVKLTERQKRPEHVNPWNALAEPTTLDSYRTSYIGWHKGMAHTELDALTEEYGLKVHRTYVADDGWCDGFKTLHAIVETSSEGILKIKWHDGNQSFMKRTAGWSILSASDLR